MEKKQKKLLLLIDRILAQGLFRQLLLLTGLLFIIFVFASLLLSLSGSEWIKYCEDNNINKWAFPFYLLIIPDAFDNFCRSDVVGSLPVIFACIIYIIGVIVFGGMLISVMTNMIGRRIEKHVTGKIHYLISGHYVIMGYDDIVPSFINYIFKKKDEYVLILTSCDVREITEKLRRSFSKEQMKRIIINYGHCTNEDYYEGIHLESAKQVFVVGPHSHPAHDAINVECVDNICRYLNKRKDNKKPESITCVFNDIDTYTSFKTTEIFGEVSKLGVDFYPYNFYIEWAKQVFVKRKYVDMGNVDKTYSYPTVFGNGIGPEDDKYVHLVFVGITDISMTMALEAVQVLHFPNFCKNPNLRTRITFIDCQADTKKDIFITRNRHFFEVQAYRYQDLSEDSTDLGIKNIPATDTLCDFLDTEFEFIKGDIFSQRLQAKICEWAVESKTKQYLSLFLSMESQRSNFALSMNMPDEVYDNKIPIFIYQSLSDNFVTNLRKASLDKKDKYTVIDGENTSSEYREGRYAHIYPFGMNETVYFADDKSFVRAKLINYLYETADYTSKKFIDLSRLNSIPKDEILKEANMFWQKLPVSLRWSSLYNSYSIRTKQASLRAMRSMGLSDTSRDGDLLSDFEIEELAKVEHNRWNVEKLIMGYRRPRPEEDPYNVENIETAEKLKKNKKLFIHYCICPFERLDSVKELDREFSRYIPWIIKMTEHEGTE